MAATLTEAKVRAQEGSAVIELSGDINRSAEAVLKGAYEEATSTGAKSLVLNFDGTQFINSTGIAVIVGILAQARQEGVTISACGLSEHYQHIFKITRLSDFMPMYPDESAALTAT